MIIRRKMLLRSKLELIHSLRTFKNFGHKHQPIPTVTTLWHGFLTFSFIGCLIDWKWITNPLGKYYQNAEHIKNRKEMENPGLE